MSKITLDDIVSGYNLNKINSNFEAIAEALNTEVLYRDNPVGEPNSLQTSIDCNSKDLYNVGNLRVLGAATLNGVNLDEVNSALVWRGVWSGATTYAVSDAVSYQGSSYICILSHLNFIPTNTTYWNLLVEKGDDGVFGPVSSVVGNIPVFGDTVGESLTDSGVPLSTLATIDTPELTGLESINGGQIAGMRNRIINGGFQVDQRNSYASRTITAGAALSYTADRWYAYCTGANATGQVVAGSDQSQKRYKFTGAASVASIGLGTRLAARDTYDLNNKTVTISADLANSLLTTVTWTLSRATTTDDTFGTLASPTVTQIATGTFTVNSTVSRYNAQVNVPVAATTGLQLVFSVGAQISGTWTIGNVQLELGSVATIFEQRPYAVELPMCQHYFYKYRGGGSALGYAITTSLSLVPIHFPVELRQPPNSIVVSGTTSIVNYTVGLGSGTATPAYNSATKTCAFLDLTTVVSVPPLTAGNGILVYLPASIEFNGTEL